MSRYKIRVLKWNINEAVLCNWASNGRIAIGVYPRLMCVLRLSILGLAWVILNIDIDRCYNAPYDSKARWDWEFSLEIRRGSGVKQFINNIAYFIINRGYFKWV